MHAVSEVSGAQELAQAHGKGSETSAGDFLSQLCQGEFQETVV